MIKINDVDQYIGKPGVIIVDLRKPEEFRSGHIKGALNIPYEFGKDISRSLQGYPYIFLYCQRGSLSMLAARGMSNINATVYHLGGGLCAYSGKLVRAWWKKKAMGGTK